MLTNNNFLINLNILKENFEFTVSDIYCQLVFDSLKDKITDRMFIETCKGILQTTTKEEWNKAYGYKGRPAIADWLKVFVPEMQKKRIYKKCQNTGATLAEIEYNYPDWYLQEITLDKQKTIA
jgi:hypothetical protein